MLGLKPRTRGLALTSLAALTLPACGPSDVPVQEMETGTATVGPTDTEGGGVTTDYVTTETQGLDTYPGTTAASASGSTTGTGTGWETTGTDSTTTQAPDECTDDEVAHDDACCLKMTAWVESSATIVEAGLLVNVNGAPVVSSETDDGVIYLVSKETGDRVLVGKTTYQTLVARVLPGLYDVVYESESAGERLPWNRSVVVRSDVTIDGGIVAVDIPVVTAKTAVLVDGKPPPVSTLDDGDLYLVDLSTGVRTLVARTSLLGDSGTTFTANLIPGTYEVRYVSHLRKDVMPYNADSSVGWLTVNEAPPVGELPAQVKTDPILFNTTVLDGDLAFGGTPTPKSPLDHGRLYVRDLESGAVTLIGDTAFGRVDKVPILDIEGAGYELIYAMVAHQDLAPMNEWATIGPAMDSVTLAETISALNLATIQVSGSVTIDGQAPTNDAYNSGHLLLGRGGDRAVIGGASGTLSGLVLADTYDPYFRHDFSDGGLPVNTRARIQETQIDVSAEPVLDLAIATAEVSGKFTINGVTPSASAYDSGRVFLRSGEGDTVHLGQTSDLAYSRRIVHGDYKLFYAVESSKGSAPQNHEVEIGELSVHEAVIAADIDVPSISVAIPNPAKTESGSGKGRFYLRHLDTKDEIFVGVTGDSLFDVTVVPGDYELVYRVELLGANVPWNSGAVLGCYHVTQ